MKANRPSLAALTQCLGGLHREADQLTAEDFSEADKAPGEKRLNENTERDPGGGMGDILHPFPMTVFFC